MSEIILCSRKKVVLQLGYRRSEEVLMTHGPLESNACLSTQFMTQCDCCIEMGHDVLVGLVSKDLDGFGRVRSAQKPFHESRE